MSRPLIGTVEHKLDAAGFHKAVFSLYGPRCYFHGHEQWWKKKRKRQDDDSFIIVEREPHERCQKDATDAMHVVPRSSLGPKSRFAVPEHNGRPGCRPCHDLETAGLIDFDARTWNEAVSAILKVSPRLGLREK